MKNNYTDIKVIGFDLDQTLYPKSSKIDEMIQGYIYETIAQHKDISVENAKILFSDLYKNGNGLSGRKTLIELEIPNAADIIQEALENADIASVLEPDTTVNLLLKNLNQKYKNIDIITGSNNKQTKEKLGALSIHADIFNYIIADEDASKSDGEAYHLWMSHYKKLTPENFLYIGDRVSTDYDVPSQLGIQTILVNIEKPEEVIDVLQLKDISKLREYLL